MKTENKLGIKPYLTDDYQLIIPPGCDFEFREGEQSLADVLHLVATQLIVDKYFKNGEFLW